MACACVHVQAVARRAGYHPLSSRDSSEKVYATDVYSESPPRKSSSPATKKRFKDDLDADINANMRLRTWLGFGWSCASACGWARRGAMPMGFEPSWSSDRTALCAKQRAPLYATHALVLSILAGRPRGSCRSGSHVLLSCVQVLLGTSYCWTCWSVASKHAGGQGPAR